MRIPGAALLACALMAAATARADVIGSDLQIAARALSFIENPPVGEVRVGIVFAPGMSGSLAEAGALQRLLGDGLRAGRLVLKPVMVPVSEAAAADVGLFFLTAGLGSEAAAVARHSKAKHIPCVTTDLDQVRNGLCVMGVRSQPRVEILVNRAAAADSGIVFSTAFRTLITEF